MKILLRYKDIEVLSGKDLLVISNSRISRKLDLSLGAPKTVSLADGSGREYSSDQKETADLAFIGMYAAHASEMIRWHITDISAQIIPSSYKDSEHVKVSICRNFWKTARLDESISSLFTN